jgi:D-amino-acid dehydrogenase
MQNPGTHTKKHTKVAVIGAGVVGLCTALELQKHGYQVTLIDSNKPGLGASFGNAGYLATELIDPLSTAKTLRSALSMWLNPHGPLSLPLAYIHRIMPWLTRFIVAARPSVAMSSRTALAQLNQHAIPAWQKCLRDIGACEQLVKSGYLLVWESADKFEEARQHAAYMMHWGIKTELVQGERLKQLEPELSINISHALFFPDAYRVKEPYQLCKILFAAFKSQGGRFIKQGVETLQPNDINISLKTGNTSYSFNKAVVCAGAWSKSLLQGVGLNVPLEAERGYHLTFNTHALTLNHPIGSAERKFVMSPLDSGIRAVGITELGGLTLKPFKKRFATLLHHSSKLLPRLQASILDTDEWMGFRPTLPDSLPVIDKHPDYQNLYFAFGNQHLGLTQAAISAELVVALMTENTPSINCEPYKVDRF